MSFRTVADVKEYGVQMLHEDETDVVLAGSTAEGTHDLLDRWLQKALYRVWGWHRWGFLTDSINLTWSGGDADTGSILYLPDYVGRVLSVYPQTANRQVHIMDAYEFDRIRPDIRNRAALVIHGFYGVEADMPSATTITATSDAAADADDGLEIRIEGLTNADPGYEVAETLTLASSTATSTTTFKSGQGGVVRAYIVPGSLATASGIITITAGSTTIERLDASREYAHEHLRTELFATTGSSQTYSVRYYRRPPKPQNSDDVILIPEYFQDTIELLIQKELERFRGNYGNAAQLEQEWRGRIREMRAWDNSMVTNQRRRLRVMPQWGNGADRWNG